MPRKNHYCLYLCTFTEGDQEEQKVQHRFSEPWEDSDLILIVEDEKFYVHRLFMSMNSPVFKAMFKSQFKDATSGEILLPEKKAHEVLEFLNHIYCHYVEEPVKITMESVEYLLKLSDEYQVKRIFNSCVKFLEDQTKGRGNVMKMLKLADLYHLDKLRQICCKDLLQNLKLQTLSKVLNLEELDRESLQFILMQRIEQLEWYILSYCRCGDDIMG